jgi:hypothetical protein
MKTAIALLVALGIMAPFATSAFAQSCPEGKTWDEKTETCVDED